MGKAPPRCVCLCVCLVGRGDGSPYYGHFWIDILFEGANYRADCCRSC
jgi:hypothetical protein